MNVFLHVTLTMMNKKNISVFGAILFVLMVVAYEWIEPKLPTVQYSPAVANEDVFELYRQRISGEMVRVDGRVIKLLRDDNQGSRHQRFIIDVDPGLTILIAHNIDLASRVPLRLHEYVEIFGQYEWNEKGGVIHWTHKDPNGTHAEGWIKYRDKLYH